MKNQKLADIFHEYKNQTFKYIEPGGNVGDQLIWVGAKKLAEGLNIKFKKISKWNPRVKKNEIIYINGSGGFTSLWNSTPKILRKINEKYPKNLTIIGPSTADNEIDYLKKVLPEDNEKIIFFAREMTTYKIIKENFYSQTYHDKDTALFLSMEDNYIRKFSSNISSENNYKLLAIRQDKEKKKLPRKIIKNNYDIICDPIIWSRGGKIISGINYLLGLNRKKWVSLHLKAAKITTNRLHSAIMGVIAKKNVELFANSYHKNQSVWEYCLKQKGVKWIESETN